MVLVVCPNLAIDYTLRVDSLLPGHVHRTESYERHAGGKGVNAARAFRTLGREPLICGFAGGETGRFIDRGLEEEDLRRTLVPMEPESRTCVIILSEGGEATVVNETGPTVTESDAFLSVVAGLISESEAIAMMGSLPPGMPADAYAPAPGPGRALATTTTTRPGPRPERMTTTTREERGTRGGRRGREQPRPPERIEAGRKRTRGRIERRDEARPGDAWGRSSGIH